jgi:hypothetical protein
MSEMFQIYIEDSRSGAFPHLGRRIRAIRQERDRSWKRRRKTMVAMVVSMNLYHRQLRLYNFIRTRRLLPE